MWPNVAFYYVNGIAMYWQSSCTSNVLEPFVSLWEGACIIECATKVLQVDSCSK